MQLPVLWPILHKNKGAGRERGLVWRAQGLVFWLSVQAFRSKTCARRETKTLVGFHCLWSVSCNEDNWAIPNISQRLEYLDFLSLCETLNNNISRYFKFLKQHIRRLHWWRGGRKATPLFAKLLRLVLALFFQTCQEKLDRLACFYAPDFNPISFSCLHLIYADSFCRVVQDAYFNHSRALFTSDHRAIASPQVRHGSSGSLARFFTLWCSECTQAKHRKVSAVGTQARCLVQ